MDKYEKNTLRVRNVPKEAQERFKAAVDRIGMKLGPALVQAMDMWVREQNKNGD